MDGFMTVFAEGYYIIYLFSAYVFVCSVVYGFSFIVAYLTGVTIMFEYTLSETLPVF